MPAAPWPVEPPGVRHAVVADMEDVAMLAVFAPGLK